MAKRIDVILREMDDGVERVKELYEKNLAQKDLAQKDLADDLLLAIVYVVEHAQRALERSHR